VNKKQLFQKVEALGCTVEIDLEDGRYKTVHITAPQGKNFGGNHELVTAWQSGTASELYNEAFEDLQANATSVCECDHETCGAWVEDGDGYCEYWDV
jgi:hypothetical protein